MIATTAQAEKVQIKWNADFPQYGSEPWSEQKDFQSAWTKNFLNGTPEEKGRVQRDGELSAEMFKPPGKGPFPFVIILHGCGGLTGVYPWAKQTADLLVKNGHGALVLDSFTTRGVSESCGKPDYRWGIRRANDAFSALNFLIKEGHAEPSSVFILGSSNGGRATLSAMDAKAGRNREFRFAAGFAIVPSCYVQESSEYYGPLVLFAAENDNANPAERCATIAKRQHREPFQLIVFKGASHGYMYHWMRPHTDAHGFRLSYDPAASKITYDTILQGLKTRKFVTAVDTR